MKLRLKVKTHNQTHSHNQTQTEIYSPTHRFNLGELPVLCFSPPVASLQSPDKKQHARHTSRRRPQGQKLFSWNERYQGEVAYVSHPPLSSGRPRTWGRPTSHYPHLRRAHPRFPFAMNNSLAEQGFRINITIRTTSTVS
ncbi:unnamed protein product [Nesidiocoris tenuis]|uniref:Uncharacterized protein n=1 Tax=Nesidiocoris tenuis TaxID=355587 RepID=A0A6H5GF37_9HEMI|nr:unnamed protein product [Nesidiocoris tenuis]